MQHEPYKAKVESYLVLRSFSAYDQAMRSWTARDDLISTLAFALRQSRPLLRRIAAEKHPSPTDLLDPAMMAAEKILQQLELSGYEVLRKDQRQRPHHTP